MPNIQPSSGLVSHLPSDMSIPSPSVLSRAPQWLALLVLLPLAAAAEVRVDLSSRFLARGEQALLEITTMGDTPDRDFLLPEIPGVEIRPAAMGFRPQIFPGRVRGFTQQFTLQSYDTGIHTIPAFEVSINGEPSRSQPLSFEVFSADELQWQQAQAGGQPFRYATAIRALKPTVYEGETIPVEIKIYVPQTLRVEDWGIPEFQVDGVAAWRFEPSRLRSQLNLLGQPYFAMAYPSSLAATRAGDVDVGPASVRLTTVQVVMDRFMRQAYEQIQLSVPKTTLKSLPLPPGAPDGFDNAVGNFTLRVSTAEEEVREGDPVAVDLRVSGTGNLDVLRAPRPVDADGWRAYDATAVDRGTERTRSTGEVHFRQFLRPTELKSAIPAYRLVFFNPESGTYETVNSDPIPLTLLPGSAGGFQSTAPPPAASTPVERMTDILAIIRPASLTAAPAVPFSPWWIHGAGLLGAFLLGARALWMRIAPRLRRDPVRTARQQALREMQAALPTDEAGFLRAVGTFIERWLPAHDDPALAALLAERDAVCFRKEKPATPLDARRRSSVLASLRRAAARMICLGALAFCFGVTPRASAESSSTASAALEAYESARFSEAARLWLNAGPYDTLTADTLYNIGNASYRLGSPGHAALYYRRALLRDATHAEARQNLRFIERKVGAVTITRPNYQYALARVPLVFWQHAVAISAWVFVVSLMVFPATRRASGWRLPAIAGLVVAPLVATCAGLAWRYYPDDAEFAPPARQAVVIDAGTLLHTEASRTAPEVIEAPPGSLLEILEVRGEWAYVGFATGTRGWIPLETLETIIPEGTPEPPALRKPRADGSSA